jgi:hypothetical protein
MAAIKVGRMRRRDQQLMRDFEDIVRKANKSVRLIGFKGLSERQIQRRLSKEAEKRGLWRRRNTDPWFVKKS